MGILKKSGKARYYPKAADLSQGRSWVLDRSYAGFRELRHEKFAELLFYEVG